MTKLDAEAEQVNGMGGRVGTVTTSINEGHEGL